MGSDDSQLGFSIKSQVGANSTLINASGQTTFEYSVEGGSVDIEKINAINSSSKIRDRVKAISDAGAKLVFSSVPSSTFQGNLDLVESTLKQSLADLLLVFYTTENRTVLDVINELASRSKDALFEKKLKYAMKNLLRVAALGMMPGTEWDGDLTAYGGYLVVRSDGKLGCFHLQKDDEFKNYLLENTKFETPSGSTGRQPFGELQKTESGVKFSLRLQIRFT
jgi:type II restriction enzyme